jgi:hypothetical protein
MTNKMADSEKKEIGVSESISTDKNTSDNKENAMCGDQIGPTSDGETNGGQKEGFELDIGDHYLVRRSDDSSWRKFKVVRESKVWTVVSEIRYSNCPKLVFPKF